MTTPGYYVDNEKLHAELVIYRAAYDKAKAEGLPRPVVSDYIARAIILINEKLATAGSFSKYTFVDEMIADGIRNSLEYLHDYNPEKYNKAFNYLTTISYYAFIRRLKKERQYLYTKLLKTQHDLVFEEAMTRQTVDEGSGSNQLTEVTDYANHFIDEYEAAIRRKKEGKKSKSWLSRKQRSSRKSSPTGSGS